MGLWEYSFPKLLGDACTQPSFGTSASKQIMRLPFRIYTQRQKIGNEEYFNDIPKSALVYAYKPKYQRQSRSIFFKTEILWVCCEYGEKLVSKHEMVKNGASLRLYCNNMNDRLGLYSKTTIYYIVLLYSSKTTI